MTELAGEPVCEIESPGYVPWFQVPEAKRLTSLSHLWVVRQVEHDIHAMFDKVRKGHRDERKEPRNIALKGSTGVGKSTILSRYLAANRERRDDNGCLVRPVLLVEIKNSTTPTSLGKFILNCLGITDPDLLKGSAADLAVTIKLQLRAQKVELVILDEFSNAITLSGHAQTNRIATWVKDLCKSKTRTADTPDGQYGEAIPFVICGTNRKIDRLLEPSDNDELATLTPIHIEIDRYAYDTDEQKDQFRAFLDDFDNELPFDEFSHFGTVDDQGMSPLADKIYQATYGIVRLLVYLIVEAAENAILDGSAFIKEHHLYKSIEVQRGILKAALRENAKDGKAAGPVMNPFVGPNPVKRTAKPAKKGAAPP